MLFSHTVFEKISTKQKNSPAPRYRFEMQSFIENTDVAIIHSLEQSESAIDYQPEFYTSTWLKPALGPHSEDLNAKRMAFHAGPCWLKILVADRVAGSIIGKGGKVITDIETACGCIMKLSPGMLLKLSIHTIFRPNFLSRNSRADSGYIWYH